MQRSEWKVWPFWKDKTASPPTNVHKQFVAGMFLILDVEPTGSLFVLELLGDDSQAWVLTSLQTALQGNDFLLLLIN